MTATCTGPYVCPTSGDVECCPEHSGFDHCCDQPALHRPVGPQDCICPPVGAEGPVRWECLWHSGALNPDGAWANQEAKRDDNG